MRYKSFYVEGKSLLHRLHPSTKLALYGIAFVLTYAVAWQARWILAAAVFIGLWLSGIPPSRYKLMLFVTGMATLTIPILNGLWSYPKDPLILPIMGDFGVHRFGLEQGLAFAGLYSAIGMATIAFLLTTRIWEIAEAPTMLGIPHFVGFALAYVFRYIPEVLTRYLDLTDVWRTRGVVFNKGPIWERFWIQCRLLTTLLILEFSSVRTKSNAVEARGFSLKKRGTFYILSPIPKTEKILMFFAVALTTLYIAVQLAASIFHIF